MELLVRLHSLHKNPYLGEKLLFQKLQKLILRENRNVQLLGAAQLGACVGSGHHISGLFGHGGGGPAASLLDHLSRFLPREFLQTAGEDESHSGKTAVKYFLLTGYVDPGGLHVGEQARE